MCMHVNVLHCRWLARCVQNSELGAEEAFKILHHAFEMIGDPVSIQTTRVYLLVIGSSSFASLTNFVTVKGEGKVVYGSSQLASPLWELTYHGSCTIFLLSTDICFYHKSACHICVEHSTFIAFLSA